MTPTGSAVAGDMIKSLKLANKKTTSKYAIIAVDMSAVAAGFHWCDNGFLIPQVSSHDYVESIIEGAMTITRRQFSVDLTTKYWLWQAQLQ